MRSTRSAARGTAPVEQTPRQRSRPQDTRSRSTDGWSVSNILQVSVIVVGVAGAVLGAYLAVQGRLASHDTDIAKVNLRVDSQQQLMAEVRGSLNTISQQISDLRTAMAAGRRTR